MYKLVIVGGKLRGKEFELSEGEKTFGRSPEHEYEINCEGISKNHFKLTISEDSLFLEDLKSSNGTMVNGKVVKSTYLNAGDKIAVPGCILQVINIIEKKKYIKKDSSKKLSDNEVLFGDSADNPIEKIKHLFKTKLMSPVYKINEEYEWSVLIAILLTVFIIVNIGITIVPIFADNKLILFRELSKRAIFYADQVARLNAVAMERNDLEKIDTVFLDKDRDVHSYELIDESGIILRPFKKLNEHTNDTFSIRAKEWANSKNPQKIFRKILSSGQIGIAKRIKAYNPSKGFEELVGVIVIRFAPSSWLSVDSSRSQAYFRALIISALFALFLYGSMIYLTIRPILEIQYKIEDFLRGRSTTIESKSLFKVLNPLRNSINTLIQKIMELDGSSGETDSMDVEDDFVYVDKFGQILDICPGPAMVLDSNKLIKRINVIAEDILGLRETAAKDSDLYDVAKEKGLAATISDLCDQSASTDGDVQRGSYELQGYDYELNVVAMMGRDSFAKAFLITFSKEG